MVIPCPTTPGSLSISVEGVDGRRCCWIAAGDGGIFWIQLARLPSLAF